MFAYAFSGEVNSLQIRPTTGEGMSPYVESVRGMQEHRQCCDRNNMKKNLFASVNIEIQAVVFTRTD